MTKNTLICENVIIQTKENNFDNFINNKNIIELLEKHNLKAYKGAIACGQEGLIFVPSESNSINDYTIKELSEINILDKESQFESKIIAFLSEINSELIGTTIGSDYKLSKAKLSPVEVCLLH